MHAIHVHKLDTIKDVIYDIIYHTTGRVFIDIDITKISLKDDKIVVEGRYSSFLEQRSFKVVLTKDLELVEYELK